LEGVPVHCVEAIECDYWICFLQLFDDRHNHLSVDCFSHFPCCLVPPFDVAHLDLIGVSVVVVVATLPDLSVAPLVAGIIFQGLNIVFNDSCFSFIVGGFWAILFMVAFMACLVAVEASSIISLSLS